MTSWPSDSTGGLKLSAMTRADRVAALDEALDHSGDLWQFGTATLKGFVDAINEDEKKRFEDMLDPDDPLLQTADPLLQTADVAGLEGLLDPDDPLLRKLSNATQPIDVALANGDDLSHFGTHTLKVALAARSVEAPMASLDRDVANSSHGRVPGLERRERLPQGPHPPPPAAPTSTAQPFGSNTLRSFAAGAPPTGFPVRYGDPCSSASPRKLLPPPAASPRTVAPPTMLHGSVTDQQAVHDVRPGVSPRCQLPQPAAPQLPPPAVANWRLTENMMHQKWGSVLCTLQPGALNQSGRAGHLDGHLGRLDGISGSSQSAIADRHCANMGGSMSGCGYGSQHHPTPVVPSVSASNSHSIPQLRATTPRAAPYRRII